MNSKNKITNIDNINIITNGTLEELETIDPKQIRYI